MSLATSLFNGLVVADQTALVRRLLSQSKDIGTDNVFSADNFDQAYSNMKRYRFRWMILTDLELAELKAGANYRYHETLDSADLQVLKRKRKLVDELEMAELVASEVIDPSSWKLVVSDYRQAQFLLHVLKLAKVPVIETQYGVWIADDKVLDKNYAEAERIVLSDGGKREASFYRNKS